jgi:hypothetical protein
VTGAFFFSDRELLAFSGILGAGARAAVSNSTDLELFVEADGLFGTVSAEEMWGGQMDRRGWMFGARAFLDLSASTEVFASLGASPDVSVIHTDTGRHESDPGHDEDGRYSQASFRLGLKFDIPALHRQPRLGFYLEGGLDFPFDQEWFETYDWSVSEFDDWESINPARRVPSSERMDSVRWMVGVGFMAEFWR